MALTTLRVQGVRGVLRQPGTTGRKTVLKGHPGWKAIPRKLCWVQCLDLWNSAPALTQQLHSVILSWPARNLFKEKSVVYDEERSSRSDGLSIPQWLWNWEKPGSPLPEREAETEWPEKLWKWSLSWGRERRVISICLTCGKIKHKSSKSTTRGKHSGVRHVLLGDLRWVAKLLCVLVSCTWASLVAQIVKKKSACDVGDLGPIPGLGRSPGGGHGNPLQ